jgi:hypothetical protein
MFREPIVSCRTAQGDVRAIVDVIKPPESAIRKETSRHCVDAGYTVSSCFPPSHCDKSPEGLTQIYMEVYVRSGKAKTDVFIAYCTRS